MTLAIVQIITSFTGSLGFSLLFGLRGKQLPVAAFGAALTWLVYLLAEACGSGMFLANVLAATFAGIFTEVFVHLLKVPKTVLTFSVVVSLIPGRDLYNTMNFAVSSDYTEFLHSGTKTLAAAAAIAIGLTVVMVGTQLWHKVRFAQKIKK